LAIIFFATPDVLVGLFTLANYERSDPYGVIAPMRSGCASIIQYPLEDAERATPPCILGMFDVSARPCVPEKVLTFNAPTQRLAQMALNIQESFLITQTWDKVRQRLPS
jgi:hypothetical protein